MLAYENDSSDRADQKRERDEYHGDLLNYDILYMRKYIGMSRTIKPLKGVLRRFGDYENSAGYRNEALRAFSKPGVTLVRDKESAREVIETLYKYKDRWVNKDACLGYGNCRP